MLGQDLTAQLARRHQLVPLNRRDGDITDSNLTAKTVERSKADVVIHAAAFTAVDECERQPARAFQVNAEGTRNVAQACRRAGLPVLYLSTDYVFDGEKAAPYVEDDAPNPVNVYGRSKLEGERNVRELLERFWIVRTSWLFGPLGKNFVRAILERAREGEPLRVVNDQFGAPTYTEDLAEKLEQILERGKPGIYHVTNAGYCSWFDFAQEVLRQAGLSQVKISPIPTCASDRPARRPRNSCLANTRLEAEGLGALRPWQQALERYLWREAKAGGGSQE